MTVTREYECPVCGFGNPLGNRGAQSVVEVACVNCDAVYEVDQYRHKVEGVVEKGNL